MIIYRNDETKSKIEIEDDGVLRFVHENNFREFLSMEDLLKTIRIYDNIGETRLIEYYDDGEYMLFANKRSGKIILKRKEFGTEEQKESDIIFSDIKELYHYCYDRDNDQNTEHLQEFLSDIAIFLDERTGELTLKRKERGVEEPNRQPITFSDLRELYDYFLQAKYRDKDRGRYV